MKVRDDSKSLPLHPPSKTGLARPKGPARKDDQADQAADSVALSGRAGEAERLSAKAKSEPAVRTDKVEALKRAIESGEYEVSGRLVARKLLKEHLSDELLDE